MSNKITSKNLHYDQTLPPFLARLKGQHAIDADSPDPILASRRRAAKPRSASEEAEDAPLVVDDEGNVVRGVEVARDGTVRDGRTEEGENVTAEEKEEEVSGGGDKERTTTAIGFGSKKRKVGKIVGLDDADEGQGGRDGDGGVQARGDLKTDKKEEATRGDNKSKASGKAKKKAKKIKLSFGDDDDGD